MFWVDSGPFKHKIILNIGWGKRQNILSLYGQMKAVNHE